MIRKVLETDYPEIIDLLSNLSPIKKESLSKSDYLEFIKDLNKDYQIWVIEMDNKLVASGTIYIETKLIHNLGKVCHIEDIVVDPLYRKRGLASQIINHLIEIGRNNGCYKTILNCSDKVISLYEKTGFKKTGNLMSIYF